MNELITIAEYFNDEWPFENSPAMVIDNQNGNFYGYSELSAAALNSAAFSFVCTKEEFEAALT